MAQRGFARISPWLRQLYTPSEGIPPDPTKLSTDVSLVAPYDGGGFPIPNPSTWLVSLITPASAAAVNTILTVGADEIFRLMSMSCRTAAGADATCRPTVEVVAPQRVALHRGLTSDANPQGFDGLLGTIVGPGHLVQGLHTGGDVLTQIDWIVYGIRAPLGTCFTI